MEAREHPPRQTNFYRISCASVWRSRQVLRGFADGKDEEVAQIHRGRCLQETQDARRKPPGAAYRAACRQVNIPRGTALLQPEFHRIPTFEKPTLAGFLKQSAQEAIERYLPPQSLDINASLPRQLIQPCFKRLAKRDRGFIRRRRQG
jgi:hypothetical protein